ncbi:MAG: hypothetical protein JWO52_2431 [Gammaproteobacteria bacterium]|nr:hypothetical protein [Gammaproteobacteria bacterium]
MLLSSQKRLSEPLFVSEWLSHRLFRLRRADTTVFQCATRRALDVAGKPGANRGSE